MPSPHPAVETEIARLRREGYEVEARVEDQVTLVRRSSWTSHMVGILFSGLIGNGLRSSPRTQRIYLHVDRQGGALIRLAPRATDPPDHLA